MSSKNKKLLALLLVAVVLAIVAGYATYHYLSPQKTTTYVFNSNYSAGDTVSMSMLIPVVVDADIMTGGRQENTGGKFVTINEITDVLMKNNVLRMDVASGMPLTYSMLSVTGGSSVETYMDPTKIAVTIPVNAITGITNDLKDGSRVNIYVSNIDKSGTTLLLQSMRVLSANYNEGNNGKSLYSVTLECNQDEALKVVFAAQNSDIYLGLVDASGYQYVNGEPAYVPTLPGAFAAAETDATLGGTEFETTEWESVPTTEQPAEVQPEQTETETEPATEALAPTE